MLKDNLYLIKRKITSYRFRRKELGWLYLLTIFPFISDSIENKHLHFDRSPAEIILGFIIIILVYTVRKKHIDLLELTLEDPLTKLLNKRCFEKDIKEESIRSARTNQTLSLVYIDLDNLKIINDKYGHSSGDEALRQFATIITKNIRTTIDKAFRLGGDEFALLLPDSDIEEAEVLMKRINDDCEKLSSLKVYNFLGLSYGIAQFNNEETILNFIQRTDDLMYKNKKKKKLNEENYNPISLM